MKNKRFIKEDVLNPGSAQFKEEKLQKAFDAGCYPKVKGPFTDPKGGGEVIYQKSTNPDNKANPHVFDFPDGKREWRTTGDKTGTIARTTKWYCEKLNVTKNSILTPDQQKALKSLQTYSNNQIVPYEVGVEKPVGEGWDLMSLSKSLETNVGKEYAKYINAALATNLGDAKVWVLQGAKQYPSNVSQELIKYFESLQYIIGKAPAGQDNVFTTIDLQQDPTYGNQFQTPFYVHYDPSKLTPQQVNAELTKSINAAKTTFSKSTCKETISLYYEMYKNKMVQSQGKLDTIKMTVRGCVDSNKFHSLSKKIEELNFAPPVQLSNGNSLDYAISPDARTTVNPVKPGPDSSRDNVRERKEQQLKNLIRESLLEIKETKKKSIVGEGKIVKARLTIISENVTLKTKKQKDKFFDELLSEMVYLNSQGFDKQVITEGFWDALKGLFGHAPSGIMEYFKEYMGKWLVEHLTPMDPEGWFGSMIITGIGNLPIGDIPKLTDCNYLTKWISKTAAEGTVRKLTHEKGLDGPFYDILRNSIVDMLDETSLGSKIEEALGSFICPLLGGVKNKMEKATDTLKQKALATS